MLGLFFFLNLLGKKLYNYWIISEDITLIIISASTSGCKLIFTLNFPIDLMSLMGCIIEGLTSWLFISLISFEISVGFTEPYSSLFSVQSFLISYSFLWIPTPCSPVIVPSKSSAFWMSLLLRRLIMKVRC